jgi:tRNA threonylcarbamoyladenosine biosynthesis protein TsaB
MIGFAEERFKQGLFENIAYFEPFYLKDFVAGKPRVKGLDT